MMDLVQLQPEPTYKVGFERKEGKPEEVPNLSSTRVPRLGYKGDAYFRGFAVVRVLRPRFPIPNISNFQMTNNL